jgi:hypothetical protein
MWKVAGSDGLAHTVRGDKADSANLFATKDTLIAGVCPKKARKADYLTWT